MKKLVVIFIAVTFFLLGCPEEKTGDPQEYVKVTFLTEGGTPSINPITIKKDSSLGDSFPANPAKTNSFFDGWYESTDTSYSAKYTKDTVISKDTTLKAKWLARPFAAFTVLPKTSITNNLTYQGKSDVTKLSPAAAGTDYDWSVMSYSLNSYKEKDVNITMSMKVWVSAPAKIVWQVRSGSNFPTIVGSASTPVAANEWVTIDVPGSLAVTPANGSVIYLSGGENGGQLNNNPVDIYIADFSMNISYPSSASVTVGGKKNLASLLNTSMRGKTITWTSSDSTIAAVDTNGDATSNITSFSTDDGGSRRYTQGSAKAQVKITAKAADNATQFILVNATTEGQEDIMSVTPFKSYFPSNFLVGNIAARSDVSGGTINSRLTRHFNFLTAENDMKPDALTNGRNSSTGAITYTWTNADNFVNAARSSDIKILGHTLLWHSQIPQWQKDMATAGNATALAAMKKYITEVMTHFKGKIYAWDVLNEIFPDSVQTGNDWKAVMRQENPWYKAIGSDFVYQAYLAARLADPDAILYYNDFNTDQAGKAAMIHNMVRDVNQQYAALDANQKPAGEPAGRLLIEGIGMQEHHNLGVSAASIRTALTTFRGLTGVKVSVSEIDVLAYDSYSTFSSATGAGANKNTASTATNNDLLRQAKNYQEYMQVYMDFKDIIERISIWGVTDNNSWRSGGLPLLFDSNGKAKPAYYYFAGAVTK